MTIDHNEQHRLEDLQSYGILDTPAEAAFDSITQLIANLCDAPIAMVSLVDKQRAWFKSAYGLNQRENDRNIAFCAHTILSHDLLMVEDTLQDPRFSDNPMVTTPPHIRFYAGAPIISPSGHALGALAIKDYQPRTLTPLQLQAIKTLANQVMMQLETRRQRFELEKLNFERKEIHQALCLQTRHLEKEGEFLSALLESLSEGIVACDDSGKLSLFNRATRELHGLEQEALAPDQWADHYDLYLADGKTRMPIEQVPLYRAFQGERISEEELVIAPKNGTPKFVRCTGQPILRADGHKLGAVVAMRDTTEQKIRETALIKSEAMLSATFSQSYLYQSILALDGTLIDINDKALQECGYMRETELGKKFWRASWWRQDPALADYIHALVNIARQGDAVHITTDFFVASGERRKIELALAPIRNSAHEVMFLHASGQDVTERLIAATDLASSNRALRLLSLSNALLVRTKTETELLQQLCQLLVNIGGYEMAWVGYAEADADKSITPMAHYGNFFFPEHLVPSWAEDNPLGRGPAGKAIRTGQPVFISDIMLDDDFAPWIEITNRIGFRGVVCLPLMQENCCFGMIAMYAREVSNVTDNEIKLLKELADNLSLGIVNLRTQQKNAQFQKALLSVAASVSANIDGSFFNQLTNNMVEAMNADAGLIAKFQADQPHTLHVIACAGNEELCSHSSLSLNAAQYAWLMVNPAFELHASAFEHFPVVSELQMRWGVGQHLMSPSGESIGIALVLFKNKTRETNFTDSLLKIFAARAGAELKRLETEHYIREQASLLDQAQDAIIVRDMNKKVQFWNKGAERLYGWSKEEAIGTQIETLLYPDPGQLNATMQTLLATGEWDGEITHVSKQGVPLDIESHWTLVYDDQGKPKSVFTINTNITERKAAIEKIQYLAFYDPLTSLANRTLLMERLKHALSTCERSHQYGALLFIDLDNFKSLNDTLGHDKGDLLLKAIAERLQKCVRESDSVARLGGDEFVILLENISRAESEAAFLANTVAKKVLQALNEPFTLDNYQHEGSASIGITLFSQKDKDINEPLKRADLAMYEAKAQGRNSLRFFDPKMQSEISARVELESELRRSISQGQLTLNYQPQINDRGEVVGAETLARWQHPVRGMMLPATFIALAEETKLIIPIGLWVLETACTTLVRWRGQPDTEKLTIAVNVSEVQFSHPDFVSQVFKVLDDTGANGQRLKLELTESLFAKNVDDIIIKMHQLKSRGVSFSLDDFGTGYSSLTYLKSMPLDQIKIDQSFVRDVLIDPNDASIAQTIIALATSLKLEVIAEGVENEAQRTFLHNNGCYLYQGYWFSKPLPLEHFEKFYKNLSAHK